MFFVDAAFLYYVCRQDEKGAGEELKEKTLQERRVGFRCITSCRFALALALIFLYFSFSVIWMPSVMAEEIAPELWVNRSSENWQALEKFSRKGRAAKRRSVPVSRRKASRNKAQGEAASQRTGRSAARKPVAYSQGKRHNGLAPPRYADESPFSAKRQGTFQNQRRPSATVQNPSSRLPANRIKRQPLPPPRKRLAVNAVRSQYQAVQIDRGDLQPLGRYAWQDITVGQFEKIAARFHFPLASAVSQKLLLRLLVSPPPPRLVTGPKALRFEAVRLDLLLRMGAFRFVEQVTDKLTGPAFDELKAVYLALGGFARLHSYKQNCALVDPLTGNQQGLPTRLREMTLALKVYCAVRRADLDEANLLMEAAQEQGGIGKIPTQVMLYLKGNGALPDGRKVNSFKLTDYLFLELIGRTLNRNLLEKAESGVLMRIARSKNQHLVFRLFACEKLARSMPEETAGVLPGLYQQWVDRSGIQKGNPASERAVYLEQFRQAVAGNDREGIRTSLQRLVMVSRRAGLLPVMAYMTRKEILQLKPVGADPVTSASVVAMLLARHDVRRAFDWLIRGPRQKAGPAFVPANWLPLVEIADDAKILPKGSGFQAALDLIRVRRLRGLPLHKYITVAESLRYNVPVPVWQTISNEAQPQKGYLPPTGALAAVRKAAKNRASGQLVLMLILAGGPNGVGDMHLIALRDIVRAFVDAGLESEARALGFEALSALWPS